VLTTVGLVIQILLLASFILLLVLKDRVPALGKRFVAALWGLAIVALLAHADFFTGERLHNHEFYHYYVATKFFPEVGYSGLYDATVLADYEDDRASYDPDQGVRSLVTYEMGPRRASLTRAAAIRGRFSAERWAAFKSDIAFFREADGILWTMGDSLQDHGYNGSPLVTAVLGGLARQPILETPAYVRLAAWFDLALVVAAAVIAALTIGPAAGALFLFFWAANPLNDHAYIGWAYLRYLHVIALFVALAAYAKRRFVLSGAGFAVAALLRVFPGFFVAGLLAQNLLSRDRRALLRRHAPLCASAAATALILVAATSLVRSPDGGNPWIDFFGKLELHSRRLSPNVLGLAVPFFYGEEHNVAAIQEARKEGRIANWTLEADKAFARHRGPYLAVLAVLVLALAALLRRGRPEDGFLAGLVLVYAGLHIAHYDYCVLALVPFFYPGRRDPAVVFAAFMIAAAAARLLPKAVAILDFRCAVWSLLLGFAFVALMVTRVRERAAGGGPLPDWRGGIG